MHKVRKAHNCQRGLHGNMHLAGGKCSVAWSHAPGSQTVSQKEEESSIFLIDKETTFSALCLLANDFLSCSFVMYFHLLPQATLLYTHTHAYDRSLTITCSDRHTCRHPSLDRKYLPRSLLVICFIPVFSFWLCVSFQSILSDAACFFISIYLWSVVSG